MLVVRRARSDDTSASAVRVDGRPSTARQDRRWRWLTFLRTRKRSHVRVGSSASAQRTSSSSVSARHPSHSSSSSTNHPLSPRLSLYWRACLPCYLLLASIIAKYIGYFAVISTGFKSLRKPKPTKIYPSYTRNSGSFDGYVRVYT